MIVRLGRFCVLLASLVVALTAPASASAEDLSDASQAEAIEAGREEYPQVFSQPLWSSLLDRLEGARVVRYLGANSARVDLGRGKPEAVLESTLPLRAEEEGGELAPISTDLVATGAGLQSENTLTPVTIARDPSGWMQLEDSGIRLTPVTHGQSSPALLGDKAFFGAFTPEGAADLLVAAVPTGAEAFVQIRGAEAPTEYRWKVRLPDGATIHQLEDGSVEIRRDQAVLAAVLPPYAADADRRSIPSRLAVAGDEITLEVDHRDERTAYPVLADPIVSSGMKDTFEWRTAAADAEWTRAAGGGTGLTAWSFGRSEYGRFVTTVSGVNYPGGANAGWRYRAPGHTYIFMADFKGVYHTPNNSCARMGIVNSTGTGLDSIVSYRRLTATSNSGPEASNANQCATLTNENRFHCTTYECGPHRADDSIAGTRGNFAYASLQMPPAAVATPRSPAAALTVGGADVLIFDDVAPTFTGLTHRRGPSGAEQPYTPGGWLGTDDRLTATASGADDGLGMWAFALLQITEGSSETDIERYFLPGCDGERGTTRCTGTKSHTFAYNTSELPEGENLLGMAAYDRFANVKGGQWHIKIDRTEPGLYLGGTLWPAEGAVLSEPTYTLEVDAEDGDAEQSNSGVASVVVKIDGNEVHAPTQTCTATKNCSLSTSWTLSTAAYAAGPHRLEVVARDFAGHEATEEQTFVVRHVPQLAPQSDDVSSISALRIDGEAADDAAGSSVAVLGDVNADGYDDYAVGAPNATVGTKARSGAVYVVFGRAEDARSTVDLASLGSRGIKISGAQALELAGTAVASAGDVDGDGVGDLLIGAPTVEGVQGRVYVVFGKSLSESFDLANLGGRGFAIRGPLLSGSQIPLSGERSFGSYLSGPGYGDHTGFGDVNGDELDDVVIGSPTESNGGLRNGATYVVFGRSSTGDVNVTALGANGFRVTGPASNALAGTSATLAGDVNADDLADVVITAPGVNRPGRTDAGTAYVVHGQAETGTIDLAGAWNGYVVHGRSGDRLGASAAPAGDIDGDGIGDVALGGTASYIVLGQGEFRTDDLDLENSVSDANVRIVAPGGVATVGTSADLNRDQQPDVVLGLPQLDGGGGRALSLISQEGRDEPLAAETHLNQPLAGQQGAFLVSPGAGSQRAGSAVASYDVGPRDLGGIVVGAPGGDQNGRASSGSVYVVPADEVDGANTPETEEGGGATIAASGRGCAPIAGFAYRRIGNTPRCRRTQRNRLENPRGPGRCGAIRDRSQCARRPPPEINARRRPTKRLRNGPDTVDGQPVWPLQDSLGQTIAYIRETKSRRVRMWALHPSEGPDATPVYIGETNGRPKFMRIEGRPCATTEALENRTAIIFIEKRNPTVPTSIRGLIDRDALQGGSLSRTRTNDAVIDNYYRPCTKQSHGPARRRVALPSEVSYRVPQFVDGDRYQAPSTVAGCRRNYRPLRPEEIDTAVDAQFRADPPCGASYWNYTWPQGPPAPRDFPPIVMGTLGSTAVSGGGNTRAIWSPPPAGRQVALLDRHQYLDPNVPCEAARVAAWQIIKLPDSRRVYTWVIRRHGDNSDPPAPGSDGPAPVRTGCPTFREPQ